MNIYGQLGIGDFKDKSEPTIVKPLQSQKIVTISAGVLHSGAITEDGKLYMWGHNPDCRLLKPIKNYKKSGRPMNYAFS